MVDNIVTKPLGLVLIATAHMVFNGPSQAEVIGILGSNITLQFIFNNTAILPNSHFAVYTTGGRKIAECTKCCSGRGAFDIYPENTSVLFHITNLTLNHSESYWASLFMGTAPPKESNIVHLLVQEENRSSITVPPVSTNGGNSSTVPFPFHIVTGLVVLPVVLLAAVLPWLIWCLVRTEDSQEQPQRNSNPTIQETVANTVSTPSLVYSVLDFPKRPSAVLEMNPNDTEYAAVSYLPDMRPV